MTTVKFLNNETWNRLSAKIGRPLWRLFESLEYAVKLGDDAYAVSDENVLTVHLSIDYMLNRSGLFKNV